jgi:hypothetical protein
MPLRTVCRARKGNKKTFKQQTGNITAMEAMKRESFPAVPWIWHLYNSED